MRHEGQVPTVRAAQGCDALRGAVGVAGVRRGHRVGVIHVAQRGQVVLQSARETGRLREVDSTLSVRHPDTCRAAIVFKLCNISILH